MNAVRRFSMTSSTPSAAQRRWPPVLVTVLVWGLLALLAAYWGLRWWGEAPEQVLPLPPVAALNIDSTRVAATLGAQGVGAGRTTSVATPTPTNRFKLLGVVAGRQDGGAALISVDGQPARPYRVGAVLTDGVRLLSLGTRHAEVGDGDARSRLDMPAQTSVQPTRGGFGVPGAAISSPVPAAPPPAAAAATVSPSRFVRP